MFMKDYAKFSAKIAKGMKVGEDNVEIKLLIPLKVMQENFLFLSSKQEQKVNVFFGDPQATFDFDDEDEDSDVFRAVTGRRFTADASGVVSNVEQPEEDPNQAELFKQTDEGEVGMGDRAEEDGQDKAGAPDASKGPDSEPRESAPEKSSEEPSASPQHSISEDDDAALLEEMEGRSSERRLIDQDTPGWMQEGEQSGVDSAAEGDKGGSPNGTGTGGPGSETTAPIVDKEALDTFILTERPIFPEIEFGGQPVPFPDLLEKRLNGNKTWRDVAGEAGMTSGQLTSRWSEYKKLVTKKMQGGGGAA
ncbi:hypothetical protein B9G55_01345 [Saccharibacillus sp. O16]|nr:hypothetical protein B9G55_01345 [Saccharibacillus sp. O16]